MNAIRHIQSHGTDNSIDFTPAREADVPRGRKKFPAKHPLFSILIGLAIISLIAGGVLLSSRLGQKTNLNDVHVVMTLVSEHYRLPTDETPALATVTDSTKVQSSFRGKVDDGDKILIYQKNQKAIVYRPSIDRIIDVEQVLIDTPPSGTQQ